LTKYCGIDFCPLVKSVELFQVYFFLHTGIRYYFVLMLRMLYKVEQLEMQLNCMLAL